MVGRPEEVDLANWDDGGSIRFEDLVAGGALDGIVVLHEGSIAYESGPRMTGEERHILHGGRRALLEAAGRAAPDERHATYQWDRVYTDGSFFKGGFGGQGLLVVPERDVVVAYFGTHGFDAPDTSVLDACRRMLLALY